MMRRLRRGTIRPPSLTATLTASPAQAPPARGETRGRGETSRLRCSSETSDQALRTPSGAGENVSRTPTRLNCCPSAAAAAPDQRIWISTPPTNLWPGVTSTPFAATLRDKENDVDLTGLAKARWVTRASGFHVVRPVVRLADGTYLVGDYAATASTFLESEFAFSSQRWKKLDIERVVTVGRYDAAGDASAWADAPDLSRVAEVGFVDLMPGSGHGAGGYINVASFEVYGQPVKRSARRP